MILCRPAVAGLYGAIAGILLLVPGGNGSGAPPDKREPPENSQE